jgi:hypothetical protein
MFPHSSLLVLIQLGVLRLGLLEDREVGVSVFPQGEEVLVGHLCLGPIYGQDEGPLQL